MPKLLETMDTEQITYEIQHTKSAASKAPTKSVGSLSPPSMSETNTIDDELRSTVSKESDSGVHASQMSLPTASEAAAATVDAPQEGEQTAQKPKKTKKQLWNNLTISGS
jgi:peroxin-3